MRTITLITVLFLVAGAGLVFATGQQEDAQAPYGPRSAFTQDEYGETVEATGRLSFDENHFPVITSNGKTYQLMIPRFYYDDVDVEEGDSLTVEGYTVPGPRFEEAEENTVYVRVTRALIDGNEYELDHMAMAGPRGRGGPRGGGHWNSGPQTRGNSQWGGPPRGPQKGYPGYGPQGYGRGPCFR
jgi:hypothetical protein